MKIFLIAFVLLLIQGTVFGLTRKHHKVENTEMKEAAVKPEAKRAWPHLVGLTFTEVEQKVKSDRPDVQVVRMKQVSNFLKAACCTLTCCIL